MTDPLSGSIRPRLAVLAGIMALGILLLLWHLFRLQILEGTIYEQRAQQVAERSIPLPTQRGEIFDRSYLTEVATNVRRFALEINAAEIPRPEYDAVVTRLAELLGEDPASFASRVPRPGGQYEWRQVAFGLEFDDIIPIAEQPRAFPGVRWIERPMRVYPLGTQLSHVIGYVGEVTPEELQVLFNRGYSPGSVLGKSGVERGYDEVLRGSDGLAITTVDARGRRVPGSEERVVEPELGQDIVLTIDLRIQELVERALGDRVGSALVMRPDSGEILAMASWPDFDPNAFVLPGEDAQIAEISRDQRAPFLNRAIQTAYPPASTFKLVMSTAVLDTDAFPVDQRINTVGFYRVGNRVWRDWRPGGFGPLNLYGALAMSSNQYFYTMGYEYLGPETIAEYARAFGFGQLTGIDLPGETPGHIPTPEWKQETYGSQWVGGDTVNMSIGQGFVSTSLIQVAQMGAMIANGGYTYRPFVVLEARDPETGEVLERTEPELLHAPAFDEDTMRQAQEAMWNVVRRGTPASVITTRAVTGAGKTGTAETGVEDREHSWFVAYAPADPADTRDRVVVAVMVEGVNEWEWWAPKAANLIIHGIFTGLDYDAVVRDLRPWYGG